MTGTNDRNFCTNFYKIITKFKTYLIRFELKLIWENCGTAVQH